MKSPPMCSSTSKTLLIVTGLASPNEATDPPYALSISASSAAETLSTYTAAGSLSDLLKSAWNGAILNL